MTQTVELLTALKKCLKARGLNYRDLGEALDLSEASIKRLFSEQSFSLRRLEEVCRFLDMSIYDLARMTRLAPDNEATRLSLEQEQGLAADLPALTYFYLLLTGRSAEKIAAEFGLSDRQQNTLLVRLSRLKLVELHPNNSGRLLTRRRIDWRRDGPIRRQYQRQFQQAFFDTPFAAKDETFRFLTGELSAASVSVLERKLQRLERDFDELADLDIRLPGSKKKACGLMIGFRPWTFWQILQAEADDMGLNADRSQAR
jgi:DNA-binding Xre family transcriptional regulator